jgi:hypothetical protein
MAELIASRSACNVCLDNDRIATVSDGQSTDSERSAFADTVKRPADRRYATELFPVLDERTRKPAERHELEPRIFNDHGPTKLIVRFERLCQRHAGARTLLHLADVKRNVFDVKASDPTRFDHLVLVTGHKTKLTNIIVHRTTHRAGRPSHVVAHGTVGVH